MENKVNNPRNTQDKGISQPVFSDTDPASPEREGGDDSLAEASPNDSRADEKVIVNEQVSNKTVNAPSQSAVNTSERISNDDETVDKHGLVSSEDEPED